MSVVSTPSFRRSATGRWSAACRPQIGPTNRYCVPCAARGTATASPGFSVAADLRHVVGRVHRLTVDRHDHVAGQQPDVLGERARLHLHHLDAALLLDAQAFGLRSVEVLESTCRSSRWSFALLIGSSRCRCRTARGRPARCRPPPPCSSSRLPSRTTVRFSACRSAWRSRC